MAWFPVLPPNQQHPYDPGPYRNAASSRSQRRTVKFNRRRNESRPAYPRTTAPAAASLVRARAATAAAALLAQVNGLPAGQIHPTRTATPGRPTARRSPAAGPCWPGTRTCRRPSRPSGTRWRCPPRAYQVSGVSVPGLPGVLIGHNRHIAWSLTDTQNQATLFYTEQTSKTRPGQYFWDGAWRRMRQVHYTIAVRGAAAQRLTVDLTVHGPIMTQAGQTTSVDWMGNVPSPDLAVLLAINTAHDWAQFHAALADWRAPTQNFVYADDRGHIGAISAGYYPVVRRGQPWLPMPGTGADDVAGVIPYPAIPQAYDPPGHVLATANQRPVGPSYPYYIGTIGQLLRPGLPGQPDLRLADGPPRDDPGVVRGRADQPDRPAGAAHRAPAARRAAPARGAADRAGSSRPPRCWTAGTAR